VDSAALLISKPCRQKSKKLHEPVGHVFINFQSLFIIKLLVLFYSTIQTKNKIINPERRMKGGRILKGREDVE